MNFYNDNNAEACAWLGHLVKAGEISDGVVSPWKIEDLAGVDLKCYEQVHLFAGIGGWSKALRLAGLPDGFPVWTGSCPCQPFSVAGKGKGTADSRHLWPFMRDLIAICQPAIVFGEQVASKSGREWLSGIRADLEELGYAVGAADLCAASVGAPHIRQRLFWMAYSNDKRSQGWRCSELRQCPSSGAAGTGSDVGGLDDAQRPQWRQEHSACGDGERDLLPPRQEGAGGIGSASQDGGMGNSSGKGGGRNPGTVLGSEEKGGRERLTAGDLVNQPLPAGQDGRVDHAEGNGCEMRPFLHPQLPRGGPSEGCESGAWSNYELVACRDTWPDGTHKTRRFEPSAFPLAHGVSARVGRLRGYGNAIVPQVAAAFIRASLEAIA